MSILYDLLPPHWYWTAAVLYGLLLVCLIRQTPWAQLKEQAKLNPYLGTCVILMVLWWIKTPLLPGIEYHYLGATLLTLMFGWRLAVMGVSLVLAASTLNSDADVLSYPLNALLMGIVPVIVSHWILKASERFLPPQLFRLRVPGGLLGERSGHDQRQPCGGGRIVARCDLPSVFRLPRGVVHAAKFCSCWCCQCCKN